MQQVFPWVAASLVHLTLLVMAILLVPKLAMNLRNPSQEEIVIPDTTLAENGHLGGIPNPGLNADPSRSANQETDPNTNDSKGWAQRSSQSLSQDLSAQAAQSDDLIAAGTLNERGNGKDNSALSHLGGDGGGEIANFGPRGGGQGIGPRSKIFGSGSNVRSVIYVCDGSGSMLSGKDDILKREMKTAVASLNPTQQFNVLFFQELDSGRPFNPEAEKLQMATPNNKTKLFAFMDHLEFRQGTNRIPALENAFQEKPQLIYLLTDGEFDNPSSDAVMARINALNQDKRMKINTRLLLQSRTAEEVNQKFEDIMARIAHDNGGDFKKYYADDW